MKGPAAGLLLSLVLSGSPGTLLASREEDTPLSPAEHASLQEISTYRVLADPFKRRIETRETIEIYNPFLAKAPRRFHGSIYHFHRNDNFDARNFFDTPGKPLPEFKRNQFGFQLAGPILKNPDFLVGYDGLRIVQGQTRLSHVPLLEMKRGDFSALGFSVIDPLTGKPFPGNLIPESRIHPVARSLLSLIPDPNRADPDRNFVNNDPTLSNGDVLLFRVDYQISPQSKLVSSYQYSDDSDVRIEDLPGFNRILGDTDHDLTASYHRNFSSRSSTQLRFRMSSGRNFDLSENSAREGLLASLGINGVSTLDPLDEGYPEFRLSGYAAFGDDDELPETRETTWFDIESVFVYNFSGHSLRYGVDLGAIQLNNNQTGGVRRGRFRFNGFFSGDAFADFLLGIPDTAERGVGSDRNDLRRANWSFFVDDNWKISPVISLTAAISYRYYQPYRSVRPISILFPFVAEPVPGSEVLISGTEEARALGFSGHSLTYPDKNDWSPQLGLALSPTGNNRFVLRAGYRLHYSPWSSSRARDYIGKNDPFFQRETSLSVLESPEIDISDPFASLSPTELTFRGIEPHIRTPYAQDWGLTLQRQFSRNWNMEASYRGSKGTRLDRIIPGNSAFPGPGQIQSRRPDPTYGQFTIVSGGASSILHGLGLEVERKMVDGFTLRSGFDWTRSISDRVFSSVSNPRDLASERGDSSGRPLRRGYMNYILDLPVNFKAGLFGSLVSGWRLSGITQVQDGEPFSVFLSGDYNNDGVTGDRPVQLTDGNLPAEQRSVDEWFDTSAFVEPEDFQFGDSGRNILTGPGLQTWDIALSKRTEVSDGHQVELRLEFFNAFNRANFDRPSRTLGNSTFGKIFGADRAREIEIALKYSF